MKYVFHERVYDEPFMPYYDEYKGHTFEVDHLHPEDPEGHVFMRCVSDPSIKVKGAVHWEDLVEIEDE